MNETKQGNMLYTVTFVKTKCQKNRNIHVPVVAFYDILEH